MDKEMLYRFFEGKTSDNEEKQIRQWLDTSESNHRVFFQERKVYDALLLNSHTIKQKRKVSFSPWQISTAAAVAMLLVLSGLYIFNSKSLEEKYNTILVPPGQRINIILADNSNVWLNANTSFRYPTKFSQKNRTVYLDGEAYFDVSKNKKKPFIVKTDQGDVLVTGTSFNVEAYSTFDTFETSLFEGSVEIHKNDAKLTTLKPNEKATINDNKMLISKIQDTDDYLWKNGLIAFNNKQLKDILISLEKYFDINIQIDSEKLPQHTYTGKFRQSDGVDYALRVLQRSIRFNYERNEEKGTIYIK